jgi:hypothetical protein
MSKAVIIEKLAEAGFRCEKHSAQAKRGIVQRSFKQAVFRIGFLLEANFSRTLPI